MVSSIRSKGRSLLNANVKIYFLLALDIMSLLFCVNLLPLLYENSLVAVVKSYATEHERMLNFIAATVIFSIVCTLRFSMTSSAGRYFFKRAKGESTDISDFFYYLSSDVFFSNCFFRLKLSLAKLAGFFVCFLPFVSSVVFLYRISFRQTSAIIIMTTVLLSIAFFVTGTAFYLSFSSSVFLCPYIFYGEKKKKFSDVVSESQLIMAKRKGTLNKIRIGFTPWFLLCVFVVPALYVWSFYNQTKAVAATEFLSG